MNSLNPLKPFGKFAVVATSFAMVVITIIEIANNIDKFITDLPIYLFLILFFVMVAAAIGSMAKDNNH